MAAISIRRLDHVVIRTCDLERSLRFYTQVLGCPEEHGVEPGEVEQRNGAEGMGPSMYIRDPDGNVVELKGY